jgi:hypothetical protein
VAALSSDKWTARHVTFISDRLGIGPSPPPSIGALKRGRSLSTQSHSLQSPDLPKQIACSTN